MGRQSQEMGKNREDKMDRKWQSRVKTSLWCDPRLDWIPAFCGNDVMIPDADVIPSIHCVKSTPYVKNIGCLASIGGTSFAG